MSSCVQFTPESSSKPVASSPFSVFIKVEEELLLYKFYFLPNAVYYEALAWLENGSPEVTVEAFKVSYITSLCPMICIEVQFMLNLAFSEVFFRR